MFLPVIFLPFRLDSSNAEEKQKLAEEKRKRTSEKARQERAKRKQTEDQLRAADAEIAKLRRQLGQSPDE